MVNKRQLKVHSAKGRNLIRRYRLLPYDELVEVIKKEGETFLEDDPGNPLKRQTLWKAARKLSETLRQKITVHPYFLQLSGGEVLAGYLFASTPQQPLRRSGKPV